MKKRELFVLKNKKRGYAVRRAGSMSASAVESTEARAVEAARQLDPHADIYVEIEGRKFACARWTKVKLA